MIFTSQIRSNWLNEESDPSIINERGSDLGFRETFFHPKKYLGRLGVTKARYFTSNSPIFGRGPIFHNFRAIWSHFRLLSNLLGLKWPKRALNAVTMLRSKRLFL